MIKSRTVGAPVQIQTLAPIIVLLRESKADKKSERKPNSTTWMSKKGLRIQATLQSRTDSNLSPILGSQAPTTPPGHP